MPTVDSKLPTDRESSKVMPEVQLGRVGGLKGGDARVCALSFAFGSEIAQRATAARWKKMTAEIAIMNKSAVVLAADSAVTIGSGGNAKIYNTISKIFELSDCCPIAIMLFNRLDFMGLPLEVLIKEYRRKRKDKRFSKLKDCRDDFVAYLDKEVSYSVQDQIENTYLIIYDAIKRIDEKFGAALNKHYAKEKRFLESKINSILQKVVSEEISRLNKLKFAYGYKSKSLHQRYNRLVEVIANRNIRMVVVNKTSMKKIMQYVGLVFSKAELSNSKTGIVFAG